MQHDHLRVRRPESESVNYGDGLLDNHGHGRVLLDRLAGAPRQRENVLGTTVGLYLDRRRRRRIEGNSATQQPKNGRDIGS